MRWSDLIRIITKKSVRTHDIGSKIHDGFFSGRFDVWKIGIIGIASFLRVYRLEALTEFLGDQGRTMLTMYDFVERGVVPLVGPTTLSGHNLGPMFYYLLLPGYLLGRGPIGVSFWMAILGVITVVVLYETVRLMFGVNSARIVSLLWAVSPYIVTADRTIWEPNMVPLFSVLYIYLLYRVHKESVWWLWTALGITVGVLVQLHYPNVFFIGLTGLYLVGGLFFQTRGVSFSVISGLWCSLGFILTLIPFLGYEYTVRFRDITGILGVFADSANPGKRAMLYAGLDYAYRVLGRAVPNMSRAPAAVFVGIWTVFVMLRPRKLTQFLTLWLFGGLIAMTRYQGVVHDHYLYFLIPVPFFMIASVFSILRRSLYITLACALISVISIVHLSHTDIFNMGNNDVRRVSATVGKLKREIGDSQFSFTLINSRSFSDLHYRYFMRVMRLSPQSITGGEYTTLALLCDDILCPVASKLASRPSVPVLCYESHCRDHYPDIQLAKDWAYTHDEAVLVDKHPLSRLYIFYRL